MKRISIISFGIALIAGLSFCKSKKTSTTAVAPSAAVAGPVFVSFDKEIVVAQKVWPGTVLEELKLGHSIYNNQCTSCHNAFEITKFNEKKWLHEIDEMSPRADLNAQQKLALTKYILSFREANTVTKK